MVVVMAEGASEEQIQNVVAHLVDQGFDVHRSTGATRTVLGAVGAGAKRDPKLLEVLDGVHEVVRISEPYKLASRTFKRENTVFDVGDVRIGGDEVIVMAGPCSAETDELDLADIHDLRHQLHVVLVGRLTQHAQAFLAEALEAVR